MSSTFAVLVAAVLFACNQIMRWSSCAMDFQHPDVLARMLIRELPSSLPRALSNVIVKYVLDEPFVQLPNTVDISFYHCSVSRTKLVNCVEFRHRSSHMFVFLNSDCKCSKWQTFPQVISKLSRQQFVQFILGRQPISRHLSGLCETCEARVQNEIYHGGLLGLGEGVLWTRQKYDLFVPIDAKLKDRYVR
jgi:hypothetical protein